MNSLQKTSFDFKIMLLIALLNKLKKELNKW
ncbi:hypothetical protein SRABI27_03560 [Pedobacter sp. Bi27]|nr:hypothetical protein SRABI36_00268 [Pedobacter sp. Bi36]CAH0185304.1 hypothetical protein SRABI126_01362 [Pedobacter sp. Bi126]CAH0273442.1 hypothetical protein SRABI27_03560 [Pedobacter sp. Bi27]